MKKIVLGIILGINSLLFGSSDIDIIPDLNGKNLYISDNEVEYVYYSPDKSCILSTTAFKASNISSVKRYLKSKKAKILSDNRDYGRMIINAGGMDFLFFNSYKSCDFVRQQSN